MAQPRSHLLKERLINLDALCLHVWLTRAIGPRPEGDELGKSHFHIALLHTSFNTIRVFHTFRFEAQLGSQLRPQLKTQLDMFWSRDAEWPSPNRIGEVGT
jgi:hypothetical protein